MKKTLLILTVVAFCVSCVTDAPSPEPAVQVAENDFLAVSLDEALDEMYAVMDAIYGSATRSARPEILSIETFKGEHAGGYTRSGAVLPENLAYVVNFGEENGFAVLGATRRLASVIAVAEAGSMTLADIIDTSVETRSSEAGYTLDDLWTPYSEVEDWFDPEDDPDDGGGEYLIASTGRPLIRKVRDYITNPPYDKYGDVSEPTTTTYDEWTDDVKQGPFLTTKWHQRAPFNQQCPYRTFVCERSAAGCVAIAVAQIIAYNEKPAASFFGISSTWAELKIYDTDDYDDTEKSPDQLRVENDLAKMVFAIGRAINTDYDFYFSGQSFALPINAKIYMKRKLGYKNAKRRIGYKGSVITSMINNGRPAFIVAMSGLSAHAWVIDGSLTQNRTGTTINGVTGSLSTFTESRSLLHCNFGWGGLCDGYYTPEIFDLNDGPVTTESGVDRDDPGSFKGTHYNWWYRIIEY